MKPTTLADQLMQTVEWKVHNIGLVYSITISKSYTYKGVVTHVRT